MAAKSDNFSPLRSEGKSILYTWSLCILNDFAARNPHDRQHLRRMYNIHKNAANLLIIQHLSAILPG